jgi:hypothetical protein
MWDWLKRLLRLRWRGDERRRVPRRKGQRRWAGQYKPDRDPRRKRERRKRIRGKDHLSNP